jgi:eukaryotic-like serine/threonine-protein kinase
LKGMNLEDYLARRGELSVPQVLKVGRDVARGLAAAHAEGLVHRDVKPANLWLDATAKGRVKILDFGLARLAHGDDRLTQEGAVLGTPAYMAPEQAADGHVTAAADLFSLGAVLYRLCTGRRPFSGHTAYAVLAALATETPPPVQTLNPAVPAAFADLVMRLIEKDPARRPASARAVADAIYAIEKQRLRDKLSRETPGWRPASDPGPTPNPDDASDMRFHLDRSGERPREPGRRGLWLAAVGAALLAAVAAVASRW